jgi:hypothetical protein
MEWLREAPDLAASVATSTGGRDECGSALTRCSCGPAAPAAEHQDVVQSLETRLAILCGGLERCSFEGAWASVTISSAPVAGGLDTVVGVGGR